MRVASAAPLVLTIGNRSPTAACKTHCRDTPADTPERPRWRHAFTLDAALKVTVLYAVVGEYADAFLARLASRVRPAGLRATIAETGLVTFIQRFGSAINHNVHRHVLALDGVHTFDGDRPRLHRAIPLTVVELESLANTLTGRGDDLRASTYL